MRTCLDGLKKEKQKTIKEPSEPPQGGGGNAVSDGGYGSVVALVDVDAICGSHWFCLSVLQQIRQAVGRARRFRRCHAFRGTGCGGGDAGTHAGRTSTRKTAASDCRRADRGDCWLPAPDRSAPSILQLNLPVTTSGKLSSKRAFGIGSNIRK